MLHWEKSTAIAGLCAVLVACGGGGGGGETASAPHTPEAPTYSLTELQNTYDGYRRQGYQGLSSPATLNAENTGQFGSVVAELTANNDALLRAQAVNTLAAVSDISTRSAHAVSLVNADQSVSTFAAQASPTSVDETVDCEFGGIITLSGTLADDETGGLSVVFRDCNEDGQITLNGSGAIYFFDPDGVHYSTFYDGVTAESATLSQTLTGSIEYVDSEFDATSGIDFERETQNLLVQSGSRRFMMENLVLKRALSFNALALGGKLYLPDHGYVDIDTLETCAGNWDSYLPRYGKLSIRGSSGDAKIEYTEAYSRVYLDQDSDGTFDLASNLTANLSTGQVEAGVLVALSELNVPPYIGGISFLDSTVKTTDSIAVSAPESSDYDGDPVEISYEWRLNGQAPLANTSGTLASGIAQKGDTVSVSAIADDGRDQVRSTSISLIVEDAPGVLEWQDPMPNLAPGETAEFSVRRVDPDAADQDLPLKLSYGPAGMQLAPDGTLTWTADEELLFGVAQTFHFGVSVEDSSTAPLTGSIVVENPDGLLPLSRSGIDAPKSSYSMWIGNFDTEPGNEILTTDIDGRVMLLEHGVEEYKQKWLYPFAFGDGFSIHSVLSVDQDGNGRSDPLVVAPRGLYLITDIRRPAVEKYRTDGSEFIVAAAAGNLDADASIEVAVLISNTEFYSTGDPLELRVIDLATGVEQWSQPLGAGMRGLVVGNVDHDPSLEIVVGNGYVFDAATQSNQWHYGPGFGDLLALADLDNDGAKEIMGAKFQSPVTAFDAELKSSLWTTADTDTCSLNGGNVDSDPQEELFIGSCQWDYVKVIDAIAGIPTTQWTSPTQYGTGSLTSGDADNDGATDLVWGGGTFNGENIIAVAEVGTSPTVVWHSQQPAQLDYFSVAGWGQLSPEEGRAVFVSPTTNRGYDGQRVVTMDLAGGITIGEEIGSNWNKADHAHLSDYDLDGYVELLLASSETYDGFFQVRQLSDDSVEWDSGPNSSSYIGVVTSARLNDDNYEDALYADSDRVVALDIMNQVSLWVSPKFGGYGINDLAAANLGGPANDIIVADSRQLSIWRKSGATYLMEYAVGGNCTRVAVMNADADADLEIVCAREPTFTGTYQSRVIVFDRSLQRETAFTVDGEITDMIPAVGPDAGAILIARSNSEDHFGGVIDTTELAMISLQHQAVVWTSPSFPGTIASHGLHGFVDGDAKQRLTFATNKAMYITR